MVFEKCPKCKRNMSPEGTRYGRKWWECKCGYKRYLHDEHIEPCLCEKCNKGRR